jgi:hypothetical protein
MNTAEITIVFTSTYSGTYRICWRIEGDVLYTCLTTSCTEGEECEFTFPIETLNEDCDPIVIEGYIQPMCEDETSEENRVYWEVDLLSTEPCKRFNVNCIAGQITAVTVLSSGTAVYDPLNPPKLVVSEPPGGLGADAALTAVVDGSGILTGVIVDNGGVLYGANTTVTVTSGTGTLPTFSPVINCNSPVPLPDCTEADQIIPTLVIGTPYVICSNENLSPDILNTDTYNFDITRLDYSCTCQCISYSVENTSPFLTLPFRYYDCDGAYHIDNILPSTTVVLCISAYGNYLLSNFIQVTAIAPCS